MYKILAVLCTFLGYAASETQYFLETKYVDVYLDHFSYVTNKTFKLRYLINDTFHDEGGPIFFYTGNEGDIVLFAKNTGFIFDIAESFNALIVFAEHRYYGDSLPFGNESFSSPDKIGYLSSEQALADFVQVIDFVQEQYKNQRNYDKKLPVIAFGGSYGGMLSSWIRMKYPASVYGAIASSAPIWQFQDLTPCDVFLRIATSTYESYGTQKCTESLKKTWAAIKSFAQTPAGKANLTELWNFCKPLTTDDDVKKVSEWFSEILGNMAMANYPYAANFLAELPAFPVMEFCSRVVKSLPWKDEYTQIKSLGEALQMYTNLTQKTKCNDIGTTSSDLGENGWNYQACTEMIMPICSTDMDMFENEAWDFQKYSDECYKQFKVRPRSPYVATLQYGGKDIESASNIIFSNGLLDPWSAGGVLRHINDNVRAVVIPDGAHHFDLRGKNEKDSDSVKSARDFHVQHINRWIKEYYDTNSKELIVS